MKKILNIIEYISLTILLCITLTGCSVKVFTVQNNISQMLCIPHRSIDLIDVDFRYNIYYPPNQFVFLLPK